MTQLQSGRVRLGLSRYPALHLSKDVYVSLRDHRRVTSTSESSTSQATAQQQSSSLTNGTSTPAKPSQPVICLQTLLYGVRDECANGPVNYVKGFVPFSSFGQDLHAHLQRRLSAGGQTVLGWCLVLDRELQWKQSAQGQEPGIYESLVRNSFLSFIESLVHVMSLQCFQALPADFEAESTLMQLASELSVLVQDLVGVIVMPQDHCASHSVGHMMQAFRCHTSPTFVHHLLTSEAVRQRRLTLDPIEMCVRLMPGSDMALPLVPEHFSVARVNELHIAAGQGSEYLQQALSINQLKHACDDDEMAVDESALTALSSTFTSTAVQHERVVSIHRAIDAQITKNLEKIAIYEESCREYEAMILALRVMHQPVETVLQKITGIHPDLLMENHAMFMPGQPLHQFLMQQQQHLQQQQQQAMMPPVSDTFASPAPHQIAQLGASSAASTGVNETSSPASIAVEHEESSERPRMSPSAVATEAVV